MARRRPGDPVSLTADMLALAVDQLARTLSVVMEDVSRWAEVNEFDPALAKDTTGRYLLLDAQAALVSGLAAIVVAEKAE